MKASITLLSFFLAGFLIGCTSNDFDLYYTSNNEVAFIIPTNTTPVIQKVVDLNKGLEEYTNRGYVVIGTMDYEGKYVPYKDILDFAKTKGASVVLLVSSQTGSTEERYSLPETKSYHVQTSGTVYSNATMNSYKYSAYSTISTTEMKEYAYSVGLYSTRYLFLAKKH